MRKYISNSIAVLVSLGLHSMVIFLLVSHWEPEKSPRKIAPPSYIQAKLIQLEAKATPKDTPKVKPKPKPQEKPTPKPKPKPVEKPKEKPKPVIKPKEVKPTIKPKSEPKKELSPKLNEKKLQQDLANALAAEEEFLIAQNDEQLADSYAAYVFERVAGNWNRPPSARRGMVTELLIQLVPTGQVISVRVVKSSGNEAFDRAAEQAVSKVGQFDKLKELSPRVFDKYFRQLRLVFKPEDLRL